MPVIANQSTTMGAGATKILSIKILKWPQLTQKGCRLSGQGEKRDPTICCLQETHLASQNTQNRVGLVGGLSEPKVLLPGLLI